MYQILGREVAGHISTHQVGDVPHATRSAGLGPPVRQPTAQAYMLAYFDPTHLLRVLSMLQGHRRSAKNRAGRSGKHVTAAYVCSVLSGAIWVVCYSEDRTEFEGAREMRRPIVDGAAGK
jgi:hypothetical protein